MSKLIAIMSMSLVGLVADPKDDVSKVFDWYFSSGDVEINVGGSDPMTYHMSQQSADNFHRSHPNSGP